MCAKLVTESLQTQVASASKSLEQLDVMSNAAQRKMEGLLKSAEENRTKLQQAKEQEVGSSNYLLMAKL